jgi:transketolase
MNGNNMEEVVSTLKKVKAAAGVGKPNLILMHTEMGMGVDFMVGNYKWHGTAPNDQQKESALSQLEETIGDY